MIKHLDRLWFWYLAWRCVRLGPVLTTDHRGNEYFAYEFYLRKGLKSCVVTIDADLLAISEDKVRYVRQEIECFMESVR